jgi:acetyltransferase-like isoleucine patch superfamily enzyme
MILNSIVGNHSFIGGASGFSDFHSQSQDVNVVLPDGVQSSKMRYLGCAVGDYCFIGAGNIFRSGVAIPSRTTVLNASIVDQVPFTENQLFARKESKLIPLPKGLL